MQAIVPKLENVDVNRLRCAGAELGCGMRAADRAAAALGRAGQ